MAATKSKPVSAPPAGETKGGRPQYNDFTVFQARVNEYFQLCDQQGVFPDEKGMYVFLRIFEEDMDRLYARENGDKYRDVTKLARYRRESWLSRNMVADNKMASGCMNALKQEMNGGYTDRPKADRGKSVRIILPDGTDMSLFK